MILYYIEILRFTMVVFMYNINSDENKFRGRVMSQTHELYFNNVILLLLYFNYYDRRDARKYDREWTDKNPVTMI